MDGNTFVKYLEILKKLTETFPGNFLYFQKLTPLFATLCTHFTPLSAIPQLYGGVVASHLLTAINRLCVYYLKWCGHTISVKEFVTPKSVSKWRRDALDNLIKVCCQCFTFLCLKLSSHKKSHHCTECKGMKEMQMNRQTHLSLLTMNFIPLPTREHLLG